MEWLLTFFVSYFRKNKLSKVSRFCPYWLDPPCAGRAGPQQNSAPLHNFPHENAAVFNHLGSGGPRYPECPGPWKKEKKMNGHSLTYKMDIDTERRYVRVPGVIHNLSEIKLQLSASFFLFRESLRLARLVWPVRPLALPNASNRSALSGPRPNSVTDPSSY